MKITQLRYNLLSYYLHNNITYQFPVSAMFQLSTKLRLLCSSWLWATRTGRLFADSSPRPQS